MKSLNIIVAAVVFIIISSLFSFSIFVYFHEFPESKAVAAASSLITSVICAPFILWYGYSFADHENRKNNGIHRRQ